MTAIISYHLRICISILFISYRFGQAFDFSFECSTRADRSTNSHCRLPHVGLPIPHCDEMKKQAHGTGVSIEDYDSHEDPAGRAMSGK